MRLRAAWASLAVPLLFGSFADTAAAQSRPSAADPDAAARVAIHSCIERIGDAHVALADVAQRCPELPAALQAAGIQPLIIASARTLFDRTSLQQLPNLIHPAQGPTPAVAALAPILRGLHPPPVAPRSWWQRLLGWLLDHLAPRRSSTSPSWLTGVLRLLPKLQWLWTALIWVTGIALPVSVAVIVLREVRAMGKHSVDDAVAAEESAAAARVESRLALLRQLPPGQRPAQLFALLIGRLVVAGRLPQDRSLTHREVAHRARLEDPEQRQLIKQLARLSERQLYAGCASTPAGLEELLARGEDLYTTGWGRPVEP